MRLTILLFISTLAYAATGDITAVRILGSTCTAGTSCNGWVAEIDLEGLSTGGTYDFGIGANNNPSTAKIVFTVTSPGYDTSGNTTTIQRTVYGTYWIRKPYPNNAQKDESTSGGTLTVRVSLSEMIYSSDTATVTIASGFYTGSNAATGLSVTNGSTQGYPKAIGRWAWPAWERATGNYLLEVVAFHRSARNGKPLAALKYTCADEHSHSVSYTVNDMTVSTRNADARKVLVYAATVDVSTLDQGDVVTCNFVAYPWVGDATAVLSSDLVANGGDGFAQPDERLGPLAFLLDKTGTYGGAFAVVDATNGQASTATTWVYSTQGAAETAYGSANTNSYNTIGRAVQALKAYNNTNYSRNEPGGGTILLNAGNHALPGSSVGSDLGAQKTWVVVKPMSTVAKANAIINSGSSSSLKAQRIKYEGLTVSSTSAGQFTGQSTDVLWLHDVSFSVAASAPVSAYTLSHATHCTITAFTGGMVAFGATKNPWGLIRGNAITPATAFNVDMYSVLGNTGSFYVRFVETGNTGGHQMSEGSIVAFNTFYNLADRVSAGTWAYTSSVTKGLAMVQNIVERINSGQPALLIASDSSTSDPANNIIVWHNTVVGERTNFAYNDFNLNGGSPLPRVNESVKGNLFDRWSNVSDVDPHGGSADGARTGNWSVRYGAGLRANIFASWPYIGEFIGLNSIKSDGALGAYSLGFTSNRSYTGTAAGNGDYHLTGTSPALSMIPSGMAVLPYDLDGVARRNNGTGAAGAYEYPASSSRKKVVVVQ